MKKESYLRIFQRIQSFPNGTVLIQRLGEVITWAAALCYMISVLIMLFGRQWMRAEISLLVPALSFVAVSLFRSWWNQERPYEVYGFTPLIAKETKGKSFPSRHVFSIFVIGSTLYGSYPAVGVLVCLFGMVLALIRVAVGVHFPKDVVAGAVVGIACGCLTGVWL